MCGLAHSHRRGDIFTPSPSRGSVPTSPRLLITLDFREFMTPSSPDGGKGHLKAPKASDVEEALAARV